MDRSLTVFSIVTVLVLWWVITSGLRLVRPLYFPSPEGVAHAAWTIRYALVQHVTMTLMRLVGGLLLGSVVGVGLGLLMSWSKHIEAVLDPLVEALRPVPPIAFIPFFILWFGIDDTGKVLLVGLYCSLIMVVVTAEAVKNINPIYVRAGKSLGASNLAVYRTVVLPAILPQLIAGLRITLAGSFGLEVASEFMGAQVGVGYLLIVAARTVNTEVIVVGMAVLAILSLGLDRLLRLVGGRLTRWAERSAITEAQ